MNVETAPKKNHTLTLSNGKTYELHALTTLDVIDWNESGHQTEGPGGKISFTGSVYMLWLAARDQKGQPIFRDFANSIPAQDIASEEVAAAMRFINVPFLDIQKDT